MVSAVRQPLSPLLALELRFPILWSGIQLLRRRNVRRSLLLVRARARVRVVSCGFVVSASFCVRASSRSRGGDVTVYV